MKYLKKKLTIENVKVNYIANKYGTPTYCYSHSELKKNIQQKTFDLDSLKEATSSTKKEIN